MPFFTVGLWEPADSFMSGAHKLQVAAVLEMRGEQEQCLSCWTSWGRLRPQTWAP